MKKSTIISIIILLVILLIGFAYAALTTSIKGNGHFIVAKPIYETSVEEANSDNNLYSYYNIKIRNYNKDDEISMVDFDYEINLKTTDNSEVPEYYWCDQNGKTIGKTLKGSLGNSIKQEKIYKICFINSGNGNKITDIKFETTAIQKNDNEWIDPDITAVSGLTPIEASNVTLEIVGPQINNIELDSKGYSFDGGVTWQESNLKTYTENTKGIEIKVKDKSGKIYVHPHFDIENITN